MKIEIEISETRTSYIWATDGENERSGGAETGPMPPIVIAGYLSAIITDLIIEHFRPGRRNS